MTVLYVILAIALIVAIGVLIVALRGHNTNKYSGMGSGKSFKGASHFKNSSIQMARAPRAVDRHESMPQAARFAKNGSKNGSDGFTMQKSGNVPRAEEGGDTPANRVNESRLNFLSLAVTAVLGVLGIRLWGMQIISSDEYLKEANENQLRTVTTEAPRGRILDVKGRELVRNRASLCIVASTDYLDDEQSVRRLAKVLGMPYIAVRRNIQDETEGAQASRVVAYDVSIDTVSYIVAHPQQFEGLNIEYRNVREYPNGSLAAHVLGYTGSISTEEIEVLKASNITYELGDQVGKSGIEYKYEDVLQGVRGEKTVRVDASGNVLEVIDEIPAKAGSDVRLTIDLDVQKAAEDALIDSIEIAHKLGYKNAAAGAAVAIDALTGEVLALASYPTYDPTLFIGGIGTDTWNSLTAEDSSNPLTNRAIAGMYPSASTIKPLSTIAALNYGIATSSDTWNCTGSWNGFGEAYIQHCWLLSGHGWMGLSTGIINSCDVVFYEVAKGFYNSDDPEGLQRTFREWGMGSLTEIDLPGEYYGRVPDAEWKNEYFSNYPAADRAWQGGDITNIAIGQGDILVTPLQMTVIHSGLANGGVTMRPHVLKSVLGDESTQVIETTPEVLRAPEVKAEYLDLVINALGGVVSENASQNAIFSDMKEHVMAKSGTAEVATKDPTPWYIATASDDSHKYTVGVIIEEGGYGSSNPIHAVRSILGELYDEPVTEVTIEEEVIIR